MSKSGTKKDYTQINNFRELVERYKTYGDKVAFKFKENGEIKEITYKKFAEDIIAFAEAILATRLQRIAVIGDNRYEWCVSYLAITVAGRIVVPLDKALTKKEVLNLLKKGRVEAIIFDEKHKEYIDYAVSEGFKTLYRICMDDIEGPRITKLSDYIEKGNKLIQEGKSRYKNVEIYDDEMYVLLFTSGTTSEPKAVSLSQKNICENVSAYPDNFKIHSTDTLLSFLPIHHTFECSITFLYGTYCGATIAFCEGLKYIASNLKEFKITIFVAVPLVLETIAKKIKKAIEEGGKKETVEKATKISRALLKLHIDIRRKIFKQILQQLDEDLRVVLYGAAPMRKETIEWYNDLGIELIQGYGLTETSPVITAEASNSKRAGSVGKPLKNEEIKIDNPGANGIGEVLAKGPNVMLGYWGNREATDKAIVDGWFHTGDYGYIDKDGFLYITGRKSDIIVLRNGKNVYPQEIEDLINGLPYVKECIVFSREKSATDTLLCAKIVYDKDELKDHFGDIDLDMAQQLIWEDVKKINQDLPTYKHVKQIIITDDPLAKTTTQKVKRYVEIKKEEQKESK